MDSTTATSNVSYEADSVADLLTQKRNLQSQLNGAEIRFYGLDFRNLQMSNVQAEKTQLVETITNIRNNLLGLQFKLDEAFAKSSLHFSVSEEEIMRKENELDSVAQKTIAMVSEATDIADSAIRISKDALETATNAAGIAAAKPLVQHFEDRISELRWPFGIWLIFAAAFFGATIYFITHIGDFLPLPSADKAGDVALFISSKVIIVALLVGGVIWCGKLFRDAYDKRGFYQHKIAITKTYQVFMESTSEAEIKNSILRESLKHIFLPPPSTHDSSKTEVEIIRSIPDMMQTLTGKP